MRCHGDHEHIHLDEGRAEAAEQYPEKLCKAICQGLSEQLKIDEQGTVGAKPISSVQLQQTMERLGCPSHWVDEQHAEGEDEVIMAKELSALGIKSGIGWAVDDVSGATLNPEGAKKARIEEFNFFRKMGVYVKVPR